ncbi:MAG: zinc-ribbon domain-containing protein [Desulfobacteraceae bacterium]|nr:zinc-ribbon domain-containing protein [Desulfobacteraceae bacterium]
MPNKKHKHEELLKSRIKRLKDLGTIDTCDKGIKPPVGSVIANQAELAHNNTYGPLPVFYVDRLVVCRDCGKEEVWTARQQKWWYEVAKGNINSFAVKCRACRKKDQERKAAARKIHLNGIAKKETKTTQ